MKQAVHLILVSLFLEKEGQILLMERQLLQGGGFTLPGGHVDANETAYKAQKREVFEETGIKIKRKNLRLIHVMHRKTPGLPKIHLFFVADIFKGEPVAAEPNLIQSVAWYNTNELPSRTHSAALKAFAAYQNGQMYSEHNW